MLLTYRQNLLTFMFRKKQRVAVDENKMTSNLSEKTIKDLAKHNATELTFFSKYLSKTSDYLLGIFADQFMILKKVEEHAQHTQVLVADVELKITGATTSSNQAKDNADAGRQHMDNLSTSVSSLAEVGELLAGFNKIINDLSTQMKEIDSVVFMAKMLSFNATIEAARVGELGQGMSVVAIEMTKLSEQIGATSKEIQATLKISNENLTSVSTKVTHLISDSTELIHSSQTSLGSIIDEIYVLTGKISEIASVVNNYKQSNAQLDEILNAVTKTSNTLGTASANTNLVKLNLEELSNLNKKHI